MLLYYLFWMLLGLFLHFYIIFGTNLLTGGPAQNCCFLPILEFRKKGVPNGGQTEWNFRDDLSWNKRKPEDLEMKSETQRGGHEGARRAPHPCVPLVAQPTYFFLLYISTYPENIHEHPENLIPPPQPSVSTRSHLGACSGAPPEGASTMKGFYINTIAPPMKCE